MDHLLSKEIWHLKSRSDYSLLEVIQENFKISIWNSIFLPHLRLFKKENYRKLNEFVC